jgi:DNA polymerase-1
MQTVAATGRLSSTNQFCKYPYSYRTGTKNQKSIYARDENYTIISADYSQIELRIAALSGENMIKLF